MIYIDPHGSVEEVLRSIASAEVLFTEAMHGAILADTLRIPWVPVQAYKHICGFKWRDWCQSLALDYHPVRLLPLWDDAQCSTVQQRLRRAVSFHANAMALRVLRTTARPVLSADTHFRSVTDRLMERFQIFRDDVARGFLDDAT
jgi:succinoglycan biosynthesis protein ExoV